MYGPSAELLSEYQHQPLKTPRWSTANADNLYENSLLKKKHVEQSHKLLQTGISRNPPCFEVSSQPAELSADFHIS